MDLADPAATLARFLHARTSPIRSCSPSPPSVPKPSRSRGPGSSIGPINPGLTGPAGFRKNRRRHRFPYEQPHHHAPPFGGGLRPRPRGTRLCDGHSLRLPRAADSGERHPGAFFGHKKTGAGRQVWRGGQDQRRRRQRPRGRSGEVPQRQPHSDHRGDAGLHEGIGRGARADPEIERTGIRPLDGGAELHRGCGAGRFTRDPDSGRHSPPDLRQHGIGAGPWRPGPGHAVAAGKCEPGRHDGARRAAAVRPYHPSRRQALRRHFQRRH